MPIKYLWIDLNIFQQTPKTLCYQLTSNLSHESKKNFVRWDSRTLCVRSSFFYKLGDFCLVILVAVKRSTCLKVRIKKLLWAKVVEL